MHILKSYTTHSIELTKTDKSSKILGGNTINEHIQEVLEHVKCWEMEMLNFYEFVGKGLKCV